MLDCWNANVPILNYNVTEVVTNNVNINLPMTVVLVKI